MWKVKVGTRAKARGGWDEGWSIEGVGGRPGLHEEKGTVLEQESPPFSEARLSFRLAAERALRGRGHPAHADRR